jgi:hypothetical protein
MGLFRGKSERQKDFEKEQKAAQDELVTKVNNALRQIYLFPGNKSEFEDFIGYQTSWVDLGRRNLGLWVDSEAWNNAFDHYDFDFQKKIVDSGVVALVNANLSRSGCTYTSNKWTYYYGMPVKKK